MAQNIRMVFVKNFLVAPSIVLKLDTQLHIQSDKQTHLDSLTKYETVQIPTNNIRTYMIRNRKKYESNKTT